jgi:N-acetylglucosamine kinase-like BadF-type ATPase
MERPYFIGMDGGGTKTDAVLVDGDGSIVASASAGASAIIGRPSPASMDVVRSLLDELCGQADIRPGQVGHCVVGLNGIDFDDEYEMQRRDLLRCLNLSSERFALVNDGIPAVWGASPSPRCAILQHGTGFTSAYRDAYGNEALFDHLDVCQCFDMRDESLKLVARMNAGAVAPTPLLDQVLAHLDLSPGQFPAYYYRDRHLSRREATPLMRIVFDLWQQGDAGAESLVNMAMDDYVLLLKAMLNRIGTAEKAVAVIGGGVVNAAPERLRSEMARRIGDACPGVTMQAPEFPPAVGAAIMAAFRHGLDPAEFYRKARGRTHAEN